jgi:hypothetical protein
MTTIHYHHVPCVRDASEMYIYYLCPGRPQVPYTVLIWKVVRVQSLANIG